MGDLFVLYESASGYALLKTKPLDALGLSSAELAATVADLERFSKVATLQAFRPFTSAADALEQINAVSEGDMTESLKDFLELSLPKPEKKKSKKGGYSLGVGDPKLGSAIQDATGIRCEAGEAVREMLRGARQHFGRFVGELKEGDVSRAQLGLAHSYSRAKVKFNVNRADNMIIQAIALLDTLDKDVNTFVMRVREWYGWHFPELVKVVSDNYQYTRVAMFIKDKAKVTDDMLEGLSEIVGSEETAKEVLEAARASMGQDISPIDRVNIEAFAARVISLAEYRQKLADYLHDKMHVVAPNLSALIGETVGARLISHAGSLTNLAKYPASTVQILGAEKALFRALKTKGNTPKYGLIYHSSFIGRANARNKGRISRYLANKCSIATRIDCFSEGAGTSAFGEKLKEQVEERLAFYDKGTAPRKNLDVMREALKAAGVAGGEDAEMADAEGSDEEPKSSKKKRKKDSGEETPKPKKARKEKKEKSAKKEKKAKKEKA